jgi:hypothetical protein
MMRDTHHEPSSIGFSSIDRRGADARQLSARCDDWPPQRRATDGPVAFLADDIRQRLAPICRDWSEHEFESVVQRIARMKLRWMELDRAD